MNMSRPVCTAAIVGALALLAGCQDRPSPAAPATDAWVGQWNGPEGTFLQIAGSGGKYEITVRNLDGPRAFPGVAAGDRIEFERDGVKESVRATHGAETGMKWLSEKTNCLTVRAGEGYCRDA